MATRALEGVKVVEFAWMIAVPMMGRYLADNGATVVSIDGGREGVAPTRVGGPFKDNKSGVNRSGYYAMYNGGKYSSAINLNNPRSMDVMKKLIAWADVFSENFRTGMIEKWGMGYEEVRKINPNIIMVSTTNQGRTGPDAKQPGYGTQLVALSGFSALTGWPDLPPAQPFGAYTDLIFPRLGATAVIAALDYRRRTGKGQYIDMSQLEAGIHFLAPVMLDYSVNGRKHIRDGNKCDYAAPHQAYRCKGDDRWCTIAVFNDKEWASFCKVIGNPEWTRRPEFAGILERKKNEEELDRLVGEWTINHTAEEVMTSMQTAGVPAGVVENGEEIYRDPQLKHRNHWLRRDHPEMGPIYSDGQAYHLSKTPADLQRAAPCWGEHNEHVCREILGMSDEEFVGLISDGVIQ